jgi:hypothetical protein
MCVIDITYIRSLSLWYLSFDLGILINFFLPSNISVIHFCSNVVATTDLTMTYNIYIVLVF